MDRYSRCFSKCGCNTAYQRNTDNVSDSMGVPLAMPVMPIQEFRELYLPCEALEKGSLFKELYKPKCSKGGYRC